MVRSRNQTLLLLTLSVVAVVTLALVSAARFRAGFTRTPAAATEPSLDEKQELEELHDVNEGVAVASVNATDAGPLAAPSALRALLGDVTDPAGAPLSGATVTATLDDGSTEVRTTDGDGVFSLDGLRAPITRLRFAATGYGEASVDGSSLPVVVEAFWSQRLAPSFADGAGRVEGVVVDDRGTPVTAYRLMATPVVSSTTGNERRRRAAFEEVADANGAFVREVTGPLSLVVIAPGFRMSEEILVDVESGHIERVRISLQRSNALAGRVSNAVTGAPIAGAVVSLDRVSGIEPVVSGVDGRYTIASLPREKASVLVRAEGFIDLTTGGVEGGRSRDEVLDVKLTPRSPAGTGGSITEVVGIGVGVRGGPDGVHISEVFAGPAYGVLEQGDVIIEVDGVSMAGKPLREGMSAIRGESGSTIRLRVTKADGVTKSVSLERARVSIPEG